MLTSRGFNIMVIMDLEKAREHLTLAKAQWDKASVAWWEPADPAQCVTNAFYAYENLIVAVAEAHGRKWDKSHYKKAELAAALFNDKILSIDIKDTILWLNDLRKDVSYGEPGDELSDADLEGIVSDLEALVEEVEGIVDALEADADEEEVDDD
jgi:hypothetical protein